MNSTSEELNRFVKLREKAEEELVCSVTSDKSCEVGFATKKTFLYINVLYISI